MLKRLNKACKFFPCHKGLEDCTFCYCPFYPCLDKNRGKFIYSDRHSKDIWSCQDCNWIHKTRIVDDFFNLIRKRNLRPKINLQSLKDRKVAIIILGHGSRLKKANEIILEIVKGIKQEGRDIVEPAYLQFHKPDLFTSIKNAVEKGCRKIIIVPFFLFSGNHVTRDIPKAIKKEAAKYSGVNFVYAKNLGEDSRIEIIVQDKIKEAMVKCP